MTYYVGGSQQFTHSETDTSGGAIPQELGRWSVSNPAVASITQSGLASWLAPGETEVTFVIQSYKRAGSLHAVVHAPLPESLAAAPASVTMLVGDVAKIVLSGLDADSNPITELEIDSATSDDASVAELVTLDGFEFLVIGKGAGSATITIQAGTATATVSVAVALNDTTGISQSAADARYVNLAGDTMTGDLVVGGDVSATTFHGDGSALTGISVGGTVVADLAAEVIDREDADATLATLVSAEATTRVNADSAEGLARAAADTTLQGNITSEASTRSSADTTLQGNIDTEATARAGADTTETAARIAADALKAPLASPALTGVPTAPTPAALDNSTTIATTGYTDAAVAVEATARATAIVAAIAGLVNSAPGLLDTLKELADAIGDDPNFAATITAALALKAPLASPALSGVPTVPTAAPATNTTQAASTAFVTAAVGSLTSGVASVFGRSGAVVKVAGDYAVADVTGAAPLASPALTGHPTGVTEAALDNSTRLASTAYADAATAVEKARALAAEALLAPLASPALSGAPTAPTQAAADNTTKLATTAFVKTALAQPIPDPILTGHPVGVTENPGNNSTRLASTNYTDAAVLVETTRAEAAEALLAPIASPSFTGHPVGVTELAGNNSTRLASTAYADAAVGVESSARSAADALLAPLASPALTGNPTVPTQAAGNNSTRAASTAFVAAAVAAAPVTIGAVFGDAQTAPAVNAAVIVRVGFACTITQSDIFADTAGAAVVNVFTSTDGVTYTSIVASAKPTLSSAQKTTDSTLTGWSKTIAAGTFVKFVLESVTTCKLVSSALTATKS